MKATTSGARVSRAPKTRAVPRSALARARQAVVGLVSKRDFILSMPDAKAKEVVRAARAQKIKLTSSYVYMVRSRENKVPLRVARSERRFTPPAATKGNLEQVFVERVLDIGFARARELLAAVRSQMSAA